MIFTTKRKKKEKKRFIVLSMGRHVLAMRANFFLSKFFTSESRLIIPVHPLPLSSDCYHSEAPSRQTSLVYLFCAGDYKIVNETFESRPPQTRKYSLQYLRSAIIIVTKLFYIYL